MPFRIPTDSGRPGLSKLGRYCLKEIQAYLHSTCVGDQNGVLQNIYLVSSSLYNCILGTVFM
jgi:hypothetical protein